MAQLVSMRTLSEHVDHNAPGFQNGYSNAAFQDDNGFSPVTNGKKPSISKDPEVTQAPRPPTQTKFQIWKNLTVISIGFLFLFTAFSSLANIQSSLNADEGLGVASLSVIYGALVVSCMFVPTIIINKLGCKWTLVTAMVMYATYMAANFKALWGTLIPTSVILGIGAAPLWSAKCTYLTQIGSEYASIVGETAEVIIVRFFGIFFMTFQSGQITGNLISSFVLDPGGEVNISSQLPVCGSDYCNQELLPHKDKNATNTEPTDEELTKLYTLCGIYLGCAIVAALLITLFVDPLIRNPDSQNQQSPPLVLLVATFAHMKDKRQLLLIPLTIYSGIEQAFMTGDFTKSFVTCPLGIHRVGFVMVCYGVVDAICSIGFGPVVKKFGRIPLYILGAAINVAMAITMLSWKPNPDSIILFYVMSGLWGMADAIWQTQINAFYGVIFTDNTEPAFSNYRLWESIGFIMAFAWSNFLCVYQKIYILLGILGAGMIGYFCVELMIRRQNKASEQQTTEKK